MWVSGCVERDLSHLQNKNNFIQLIMVCGHIQLFSFKKIFFVPFSFASLPPGFDFPSDFMTVLKKAFRTYFAIIAHIYYHHFTVIKSLGLNDGLNTLFLHFMYFVQEFRLLEPKEWSCLEELLKVLIQVDKDLAKNPPADDFEGMTLQGRNGGERTSRSSKGATASTAS